MNEISIVEEKPLLVAGMRQRGHYKEIAEMLPALFEYIVGQRAIIAGPPLFLCHEMSIEDAQKAEESGNADIEVCVPIAKTIPESEKVKCYELPGATMAKTTHKGPYEECGQAYERLFIWLDENGRKLTGPIREAYLNDPREVAPQEILTVIYAPIS